MQLHRKQAQLQYGVLPCRWYLFSMDGVCEDYIGFSWQVKISLYTIARRQYEGCGEGIQSAPTSQGYCLWSRNDVGREDTLQFMTCYVILQNMIVEDEAKEEARTHDFQKPEVQIRLLEQEVEHIANFLEMH